VGLVIDSSASMFVKLPSVGLAAGRFVRDSLEGDDRAFVVGFGGEPELVQETTSDDSRLIRSIATLRADGQTALWEAVVYSLVQIQGAPGKKALIVYTDGADEDEDFPYRTTLRFARQVGVPVYFVLTNNEIVRTGGKGLGVRGFLGRVRELAGEVGGNIYVVRHGEDLSEVYGEIGRELRSQYLLTYYSEDLPEATYRRVRVEAVDPALRVRTIAGYFK
jgi:VWFA-related protein